MNTWIMPCNVKYYNIIERFSEHDDVVWKATPGIKIGDAVYIYVGLPYSKILYRCVVIQDKVDQETLAQNAYARVGDIERNRKYMQLKLAYTYDPGIPLSKLKELGMWGVRKQTRLDRTIIAYLDNMNSQLDIGE